MLKRQKRQYFYSDGQLQFSEVKWFRLKVAGAVVLLTVACVVALVTVNNLYYDFMGLGYNRIATLQRQNHYLQSELMSMKSQIQMLESTLNHLSTQGDQLRLLVDLPPLDSQVKNAGTGGAATYVAMTTEGDQLSQLLASSNVLLEKLSSQMNVEKQSYSEVWKKYEYNRKLFASLPALKPMEGYYSPGGFGLRMHPVLSIFKTHEGLDIINDVGTPVVAAADGEVVMAGKSGGGYGTVVVIDHGYGYQTLYAHLSQTLVREGDRVKRGELIAKSGRSGLVSGPHLHYEVRFKGVRKNPADYFFDDVNPRLYHQQVTSVEK